MRRFYLHCRYLGIDQWPPFSVTVSWNETLAKGKYPVKSLEISNLGYCFARSTMEPPVELEQSLELN
jgi:hypothetical protein